MTPDEWVVQTPTRVPHATHRAVESPWLDCTKFSHVGSEILMTDPLPFPEAIDPSLPCPPGEYRIGIRLAAYGSDMRVAAMRLTNTGEPHRLESTAQTGTDCASICVCDPVHLAERWVSPDTPDALEDAMQSDSYWGEVILPPRQLRIVWVPTGWGDGTFSVYPLNAVAGGFAGYEVEFIPSGSPYRWPDLLPPHERELSAGA